MKENKKIFAGIVIGLGMAIAGNSLMVFASSYLGVGKVELTEQQKMNKIKKLVDQNFALEYDKEELIEAQYAGYVYGLDDPYSTYLTEENFNDMMESTNGQYAGIGVGVSPDPDTKAIKITQVFTDSPASKEGIKIGDEITKVEGVPYNGLTLDEAITKIKGKPGTSVLITIRDGSTGEERDINISRAVVTVDTVYHELMEDNIGYIRISSFDEVTADQFKEAYDDLMGQNIEGLIIDLRNNPGGLLGVVSEIADILVPEGNIVYTEDVNGKQEFITSDANKIEIPLQIIVNEYSASASEVLAGAVKDYGVGELVGETTFGKGIVQRVFPLGDGSAVKLTIAKYFTPSGVCINGIGIEPDHPVEMNDEQTSKIFSGLDRANDNQLREAVKQLKEDMNK